DGAHALALANGAAAIAGIERKTRRSPAAHASLAGVGELAAHVIPEPDIGGWARTRRFADRGLIDLQYAVDGVPTGDVLATIPAWGLVFRNGLQQVVEQDFARQGGF